MMKTSVFFQKHVCETRLAEWAMAVSSDMAVVWDKLIDAEYIHWLIWIASRRGVFLSSELRKLACNFVRNTPLHDKRTVFDLLSNDASKNAVITAEKYSCRKASKQELKYAFERGSSVVIYENGYIREKDDNYAAAAAAETACPLIHGKVDAIYHLTGKASFLFALKTFYPDREKIRKALKKIQKKQTCMIKEFGNPFQEGNNHE